MVCGRSPCAIGSLEWSGFIFWFIFWSSVYYVMFGKDVKDLGKPEPDIYDRKLKEK